MGSVFEPSSWLCSWELWIEKLVCNGTHINSAMCCNNPPVCIAARCCPLLKEMRVSPAFLSSQ